jgi:hypothetical protein
MIRAVVHFWSAGATAQIAIPEKMQINRFSSSRSF